MIISVVTPLALTLPPQALLSCSTQRSPQGNHIQLAAVILCFWPRRKKLAILAMLATFSYGLMVHWNPLLTSTIRSSPWDAQTVSRSSAPIAGASRRCLWPCRKKTAMGICHRTSSLLRKIEHRTPKLAGSAWINVFISLLSALLLHCGHIQKQPAKPEWPAAWTTG